MLLDMLFAIEPKARVFALDTHYLFPETYELWREVEQRYDTKIEVFEGPSAEELDGDPRREALGAQARPLPRGRQGRAAGPRARRPRLLDHRRPPRPVADARERAEARLGRRARAVEGEPARRLERRRLLDLHPRARAPLQRVARPRLRLDRRHPLDAPRRRAARAAGPAATGPSAGCTPTRDCELIERRSSSPTSTSSRRRPSTSCARSPPSSSGRCCSSPAARTRSCCCGSPRRRSGRASSRSRSCTSTPATTSPR